MKTKIYTRAEKKRDLLFLLAFLLGKIIQYVVYQSTIASFNMTLDDLNRMDNDGFVFTFLFLHAIPLIILLIYNHSFRQEMKNRYGKIERQNKDLLSGFLLALIMVVLYNTITFSFQGYLLIGVSNTFYPLYVFIYLVGFALLALESELLLRKFLFYKLRVLTKNTWLSVGIIALLSTLCYSLNSPVTAVSLLNAFLLGGLLALFVLDTGNFRFGYGFYLGWIFLQTVLFSHGYNGIHINTTFLHLTTVQGKVLLNGGGLGPEGSLVTTGILVFLALLYLYKTRKKESA